MDSDVLTKHAKSAALAGKFNRDWSRA